MNMKLTTLGLAGLFALTSCVAQPVLADEWNKKTEFQFIEPVEIPGNSDSDRNIVQIFSEASDGNENLVATLMAIPDYVEQTPDKPTVHFVERPSGSPEAVHSWFYPGENTGWEFVYPSTQTPNAD